MIDKSKLSIVNCWYDANLPFNAVQSQFHQPTINAIAAIGLEFKGPTCRDPENY